MLLKVPRYMIFFKNIDPVTFSDSTSLFRMRRGFGIIATSEICFMWIIKEPK